MRVRFGGKGNELDFELSFFLLLLFLLIFCSFSPSLGFGGGIMARKKLFVRIVCGWKCLGVAFSDSFVGEESEW